MNNIIEKAKQFAIAAHGGQMYGDKPYVFHLESVVSKLKSYGELAQVIGYLHDVVEDTDVTTSEIESEFGRLVAECVSILTDEPGLSRNERKIKTYAKMANVSSEHEIALIVKVADRLANVEACNKQSNQRLLDTYKSEHPSFKASLFRANLCNDLWQKLDSEISA